MIQSVVNVMIILAQNLSPILCLVDIIYENIPVILGTMFVDGRNIFILLLISTYPLYAPYNSESQLAYSKAYYKSARVIKGQGLRVIALLGFEWCIIT